MIRVERLTGGALERELDSLARLRMTVFRDYPYLYEGTLAYERSYLRSFAASARSTLVVARDQEQIVGAATAMPLTEHGEGVAPALRAANYDVERVYYCGESVLLASHRGRGLGKTFFAEREAAARELGFTTSAFCAVERPANHPARPPDYRPLDGFWQRRGYVRRPEIVATFAWRDLGTDRESEKQMVFWTKELA